MKRVCAMAVLMSLGCATAGPVLRVEDASRELPFTDVRGQPRVDTPGAVTVVLFIATWCFPCLVDVAALSKLYEQEHKNGLEVRVVGMDLEREKVLVPFAESNAIGAPVFAVTDDILSGQSRFGRLRELPARFVFGRDGRLAVAYSGVAQPREFEVFIRRELNRSPPR